MESNDNPLVEGIKHDYTQLDLPAPELAMLDEAVKLTVAPSSAGEDDIETLRAKAFDDRDILDIVYLICLYNLDDRMADAMGISATIFLLAEDRRAFAPPRGSRRISGTPVAWRFVRPATAGIQVGCR